MKKAGSSTIGPSGRTYDKPFAPALMSWSVGILPKHLLAGKEITTSPLGRRPIGTGPYKFKEWVTGQKIVLVSNPDYFEGRPYIDGYILRIIPDTATMFPGAPRERHRPDGVDAAPVHAADGEQPLPGEFQQVPLPLLRLHLHGLQFEKPLFTDKRVRQAIAHAVNRVE